MFGRDEDNTFGIPNKRTRASLSLAPLIDITFTLLIFFLLASQFDQLSPIEVSLKNSLAEERIDNQQGVEREMTTLILLMHADGSYQINDRQFKAPVTSDEMLSRLQNSFALSHLVASSRERALVLETDPDVSLQRLVSTLEVLNKVPEFDVKIKLPRDQASGEH